MEETVEVWRDNQRAFVAAHQIGPGDVAVLDTGDLVPGDCRVLNVQELLIDEAALSGESFPVG